MDRGVIYVATGEAHVAEALTSAASVKRHMADLPITLFSDRDMTLEHVDDVVVFDGHGYLSRIACLQASPYERTLFLDADTYVCGDLSALFPLLDAFDVALAHAPLRAIHAVAGVPDSFPEFNAGVILYRRSQAVDAALRDWADLFAEFRDEVRQGKVRWLYPDDRRITAHDQGSLRQALYRSNLRIATLPPEYNCRFSIPGCVDGPVCILHGRGVDLRDVAAAINASTAHRGYIERGGRLRLIHHLQPSDRTYSLANLRYTLRRRGLWWMGNAALRRLLLFLNSRTS